MTLASNIVSTASSSISRSTVIAVHRISGTPTLQRPDRVLVGASNKTLFHEKIPNRNWSLLRRKSLRNTRLKANAAGLELNVIQCMFEVEGYPKTLSLSGKKYSQISRNFSMGLVTLKTASMKSSSGKTPSRSRFWHQGTLCNLSY